MYRILEYTDILSMGCL